MANIISARGTDEKLAQNHTNFIQTKVRVECPVVSSRAGFPEGASQPPCPIDQKVQDREKSLKLK